MNRPPKLTLDDEAEAAILLAQGLTQREVAKQMGISPAALSNRGLRRTKTLVDEFFIDAYLTGKTAQETATLYGLSIKAVFRRWEKLREKGRIKGHRSPGPKPRGVARPKLIPYAGKD